MGLRMPSAGQMATILTNAQLAVQRLHANMRPRAQKPLCRDQHCSSVTHCVEKALLLPIKWSKWWHMQAAPQCHI